MERIERKVKTRKGVPVTLVHFGGCGGGKYWTIDFFYAFTRRGNYWYVSEKDPKKIGYRDIMGEHATLIDAVSSVI